MSPAKITGILLLLLVAGGAGLVLVDWQGSRPGALSVASPGEGMSSPVAGGSEAEGRPSEVLASSGEGASSPLVTAPEEGSEPSAIAPPAPEVPASPPEVATEPSGEPETIQEVRFADGRLSVRLENAPLGDVLDEFSSKGELAVILGDGVARQRVSIEFSDLPLDQGLREILKDQDAFYYHRGSMGLLTVWVYRELEGRGLYPVPPEERVSTAELEGGLVDPDPEERAWALETLIDRRGELARDEVVRALGDESANVRTNALYGAVEEGIELPAETLSDLALNDPSYNVRFLALEALYDDPNEELVATFALDDPHPVIRDYAATILERLDRAAGLVAPSPPAQTQPGGR